MANFQDVPDAPMQVTAAAEVAAKDDSKDGSSYCMVNGYISPNITFKMGLPYRWNGRLLHVGCGGHCGVTTNFDSSCADPMRKGHACIVSDMGHQGTTPDGVWAYNNLAAKVDWGFRATHVVTIAGKAVTNSFYEVPPSHSYFVGGSTGGRQALQAAQKFPWDFDGIVAIAPPVDLSTIYMTFAWGARVLHGTNGKPILGRDELHLLTAAAIKQCDMDDGLSDQIIGDPLRCDFDPGVLACSDVKHRECLTQEQVDAARKVYAGPTNSAGEKLSLGGPVPGSELGKWDEEPTTGWATSYLFNGDTHPGYKRTALEGFRYLFFWPDAGPKWQLSDFDFDKDSRRMSMRQVLYDSSNPDLRRFKAAGGKLMILQGLDDNSVLPRATIDYYETATRTMGGNEATKSFFRMFLFPGVGHGLYGGRGAGVVDYLTAIEQWVERNEAPERLVAVRLREQRLFRPAVFPIEPEQIEFSRPVYPYPIRAIYKGWGDPDSAGSFRPSDPGGAQKWSTTLE
jgi:feruloyl esterase